MPLTMAMDLLGEEPLPPKLWDDDVLPEETAWLFDPAADPLSDATASVLGGLAGPYGCGAICEPAEEAAGSPVSVFYQDGCHSDTDEASDADEASGDCQESAKPECSDASGATAMDSALDSSSHESKAKDDDDAFGPLLLPAVLDEEEPPAPAVATRKRTRALEAHAESELEPAVAVPAEVPPTREPSSRASKKSRRAPPPVPARPAVKPAVLAKAKGKGRQFCLQCSTMSTPQWREGPEGARTLCNACGVRYRKQVNLAKKAKGGK